jgi:membrane-bound inhibitor of C-type lysozyme
MLNLKPWEGFGRGEGQNISCSGATKKDIWIWWSKGRTELSGGERGAAKK